ncbi:MAG: hypothetical protein ACI9LX_001504 [Paraglaciecola sp.]|jgi:hypothetical protein
MKVNAGKGTEIRLHNLSQAADIISRYKLISVDQSSVQLGTVGINAYLHEITRNIIIFVSHVENIYAHY